MLDLDITRRRLLQSGTLAAVAPAFGTLAGLPGAAAAEEPVWRHGLSPFGQIKYPPDFKHFDYVNPDAPKGGLVRMITIGTFDNFNMAVSGVKGSLAPAVGLIYETMISDAQDEAMTYYGLLAEAATWPEDYSWAKYRLRKARRWH